MPKIFTEDFGNFKHLKNMKNVSIIPRSIIWSVVFDSQEKFSVSEAKKIW